MNAHSLVLLVVAAVFGSVAGASAQVVPARAPATAAAAVAPPEWEYPIDDARDPLVPPAALYTLRELPELCLISAFPMPAEPARARAMVRLSGSGGERRVVSVGARLGPYQVVRIDQGRILASLSILGVSHTVGVTAAGIESSSESQGGAPTGSSCARNP